jgi:hypothetical protein
MPAFMRKLLAVIAAVSACLGIPAGLIALGYLGQDSFQEAVWPGGVVAALVIALLLALAWVGWLHHEAELARRSPDPEDQRVLDEVLHVLNRPSVRRIDAQDFYESWPVITTSAVVMFVEKFGDIEHHFRDRDLEAARKKLFDAAVNFERTETRNGFPGRWDRSWRDSGWTPGEAEGLPEREKVIDERSAKIRAAADSFVAAHDSLLEVAIERGFSVDAVSRDTHPMVAELNEARLPRQ